MDIGEDENSDTIVIEPLTNPVPGAPPEPAPERAPAPEREPEPVPA